MTQSTISESRPAVWDAGAELHRHALNAICTRERADRALAEIARLAEATITGLLTARMALWYLDHLTRLYRGGATLPPPEAIPP